MLPIPFCRVVIQYGEPLRVPASLNEAQLARYQTELDDSLSRAEQEADAMLYSKQASTP